jgi:hypothetical protein
MGRLIAVIVWGKLARLAADSRLQKGGGSDGALK